MYINFWYPICTSEELSATEPVPAQVLGLPFVAFRDADGVPHVLANTCVHRGMVMMKQLTIRGAMEYPEDFTDALDLLVRRDLSPMISHRFPLERFHDALDTARDPGAGGKVMVEIDSDALGEVR